MHATHRARRAARSRGMQRNARASEAIVTRCVLPMPRSLDRAADRLRARDLRRSATRGCAASGWSPTGSAATPRARSPASTPAATTGCWSRRSSRRSRARCSSPARSTGRPTTASAIRSRRTSSATARSTRTATAIWSFRLEGTLPVWTFALADALIERRVWMAYGANTTYVSYRCCAAAGPLDLEITPLVTYRDFHRLSRAGLDTGRRAAARWASRSAPSTARRRSGCSCERRNLPARRRLVVELPAPRGDGARSGRSSATSSRPASSSAQLEAGRDG